MCKNQSELKRTPKDYGWIDSEKSNMTKALHAVLNFRNSPNFRFCQNGGLSESFAMTELSDGQVTNFDCERAVIAKTSENNNYFRLFHHIRNGLAHGKFRLLYSSTGEKMMIIQDDDTNNVTARIVIRLKTLLDFIKAIDIKRIIKY